MNRHTWENRLKLTGGNGQEIKKGTCMFTQPQEYVIRKSRKVFSFKKCFKQVKFRAFILFAF